MRGERVSLWYSHITGEGQATTCIFLHSGQNSKQVKCMSAPRHFPIEALSAGGDIKNTNQLVNLCFVFGVSAVGHSALEHVFRGFVRETAYLYRALN